MLLFDVTRDFDEACAHHLKDEPDVLTFVKQHERRPLVLNNLCHQVLQYEKKFHGKVNQIERIHIIDSVAKMFIDAVKKLQQEALWSHVRKAQEQRRTDLLNEANDHLIREVQTDGSTEKIIKL